ncbi:hypothetical protein CFN78_21320 [Amycolatopsis antarctica]|uniref:PPE family domain-containing protein n=1 Tax=Amycolatopsis antarctica TaxID=1854586 RepID=A0A263CZD6_9PSEU|nr:hypothetical protein [Amycolatopsis antarctica]OZM71329.1 hypothetical protein CFN78_21320 [Amycolatopsis antarctica]
MSSPEPVLGSDAAGDPMMLMYNQVKAQEKHIPSLTAVPDAFEQVAGEALGPTADTMARAAGTFRTNWDDEAGTTYADRVTTSSQTVRRSADGVREAVGRMRPALSQLATAIQQAVTRMEELVKQYQRAKAMSTVQPGVADYEAAKLGADVAAGQMQQLLDEARQIVQGISDGFQSAAGQVASVVGGLAEWDGPTQGAGGGAPSAAPGAGGGAASTASAGGGGAGGGASGGEGGGASGGGAASGGAGADASGGAGGAQGGGAAESGAGAPAPLPAELTGGPELAGLGGAPVPSIPAVPPMSTPSLPPISAGPPMVAPIAPAVPPLAGLRPNLGALGGTGGVGGVGGVAGSSGPTSIPKAGKMGGAILPPQPQTPPVAPQEAATGTGAGTSGGTVGRGMPMMPMMAGALGRTNPGGGGGGGGGHTDGNSHRSRPQRTVPGVPPKLRGRAGKLDAPATFLGPAARARRDEDEDRTTVRLLDEELWQVEQPAAADPATQRAVRG